MGHHNLRRQESVPKIAHRRLRLQMLIVQDSMNLHIDHARQPAFAELSGKRHVAGDRLPIGIRDHAARLHRGSCVLAAEAFALALADGEDGTPTPIEACPILRYRVTLPTYPSYHQDR